jgi:hypothetical protein
MINETKKKNLELLVESQRKRINSEIQAKHNSDKEVGKIGAEAVKLIVNKLEKEYFSSPDANSVSLENPFLQKTLVENLVKLATTNTIKQRLILENIE